MHRFYLPPERCPEGRSEFELDERDARHAVQVLRLQPGDPVTVLNGAGLAFETEIVDCSKRAVRVGVRHVKRAGLPIAPRRVLVLAVLKGKAMDWVLQKATELGASAIRPVLTERTVPDIDSGEAAGRKREKWLLTAVEALKQCGGLWLPEIHDAVPLAQSLGSAGPGVLHLTGSLEPDALPLRHALDERLKAPMAVVEAWFWIGPEGDFAPRELQQLKHAGAMAVTLGRNVLRAETAALAALTLLDYELGLRSPVHVHSQPGANA